MKIFAIFKNSHTFNVVDIFLTSLCALFCQIANYSIGQSVIILVINKLDFRCAVVRFCYHEYDYRPNWNLLNPITITYYAHE